MGVIVITKGLGNFSTSGGHILLENRPLHQPLRGLQIGFTSVDTHTQLEAFTEYLAAAMVLRDAIAAARARSASSP